MKNIYLILSVFVIIFSACETDFDVNATWEEVTVVYGLLDAGDGKELQQIKISKAFLGNMDALQMAQYADSINFDAKDSVTVKIVRNKNNGDTDTVPLSPVTTIRDGGIFNDTIIIYEFLNNNFLKSDSEYELLIENKVTGNVVTGHTEMISGVSFDGLKNGYKFGFYNADPILQDSTKYLSKRIDWNHSTNGKIYQVDMVFEYSENGELKNLIWSQPLVTSDGNAMNTLLEGKKFFTFLRNSIIKDATKHRNFVNIDLIMTVGTTDLETYINVNQPITGIVQERPQFSNINHGIGIFSSRFTHVRSDVLLNDWTKDYLIEELDRNFE